MKGALVDSHRERLRRIESGEQVVVGPEPLHRDRGVPAHGRRRGRHPRRRPGARSRADRGGRALARRARPGAPSMTALAELARGGPRARTATSNLMIPTIAAARAGATTGEWARTLREVFGSYRAPTGVGEASAAAARDGELAELRERGRAPAGEARPAAEDPRRQARPRRPLKRRRADRACGRATRAWTSSMRASA